MILATRIALVVAETPEIPLAGVKVALYDRDEHSMDDFLGSGVTNEKGEVRIAFESEAYADEEDLPLWKLDSLPDLYVMVYSPTGEVILTTRQDVDWDNLPQQLVVGVPEDTARRFGLVDQH
jgi:hypothetical protein